MNKFEINDNVNNLLTFLIFGIMTSVLLYLDLDMWWISFVILINIRD